MENPFSLKNKLTILSRIPVAIRYILLSAFGFAMMSACVKTVARYGIPVLEIIAARALVSLLLSYLDVKRKRISVWGHNHLLLVARGAMGTLALCCVYYAVTTLPLADATALKYTHPAFTAILALVFLGESVKRSTLISIILSFIGLVVMVRPGVSGAILGLPPLSLMAALAGAFGSAVAYVIVRHLSQTEDSSVIIFYFPLVALPVSLVFLGNDFVFPEFYQLLLLFLVGVFTQVGQVGLTKAMALEKAGRVTSFSYIQVVFSAILGIIFFAEVPTLWTLIGGTLIISGALTNALGKG
ncbi:MAG: DMT family transporter [Cyanothece sp. SIO2G6]|nr:DMT family transporter [Cyanothece sp. SIO2G6]